MYLGGNSRGPGVWLSSSDHNTFHRKLESLLGGGTHERQRQTWKRLDAKTRKGYLTLASDAAGIDTTDIQYNSLLEDSYSNAKHGTRIDRGPIAQGKHYRVARKGRGPRGFVHSSIKGANRLKSVATGAAVASGVLATAPLLAFFDDSNENLRELAKSTIRSNGQGGLTLWDEAFALVDFYAITENPIAAGAGWLYWSASLSGQDPWGWNGGQD